MEKKINVPKKGAGRRLAARLKELGQQAPPQRLVDILNKKEEQARIFMNEKKRGPIKGAVENGQPD